MFSLLCRGMDFLTRPFNFLVSTFGVQNFSCRDVLWPVPSGAVTFFRRRTRICLCCTKHGLLFLTSFVIEIFVLRPFDAGTFCCCNILPPKNKDLPLSYKTRALFSYDFCYRKFNDSLTFRVLFFF